MSKRERVFAACLVAGMIMLAVTGVLAFMQERRLLAIQQLAETEGRREQLLDDFESNLRELRREGVNYVLLGGSTSLSPSSAVEG